MQTVSSTFTSIYENKNHWTETKISIAGVEYGESNIISLSTSRRLFSDNEPTIGCCVSSEMNLVMVLPSATIPRMAKISIYVRVCDATRQSEWIPKGVYFIDTRSIDKEQNTLTITAYDAMMKLEQPFCVAGEQGEWPRTDSSVFSDILTRTEITADSRTSINKGYSIPYPGIGAAAYSMREILGIIGAMYAGNWCITDDGKLRLVPFGDIGSETNYLSNEHGYSITIGGDRINV